MRTDPAGSSLTAQKREPRIVVGIIYPFGSIYATNRANTIANVPGNVLHGALGDIATASQELFPDEGRATIGSLSFTVVDLDGALTAEFREQLADFDNGLGRREVRVFTGDTDDFADGTWRRVETYVIDSAVDYDKGAYRFSCSDIQRELRQRIFTQATTRLASDLAEDAATLTVLSTEGFEMLEHTASFSDAPSATVGYVLLKKTGEVVRYTGKTGTTFTGCTRGVFKTRPQAVDVAEAEPDQSRWPEVEEVIYLELPAPQLAYAVMTGTVLDTGIQLPDAWHCGIPAALVDATMFRSIGADLYDPADHSAGFTLSFSTVRGLKETDGKRFIEEQLHVPMGTFSPISAEGKLGLRRLVRILADAAPSTILFDDNIIEHGPLIHRTADVVNRVIVRWNHDGQELARESVLVNNTSILIHGIGRTIELDLIGLTVQKHIVETLRRIFNYVIDRYGSPPQELDLSLLPSMNRLEVGDIARVVAAGIRDYAGLAHLDRSFEIQSRQMNWRTGEFRARVFGATHSIVQDERPNGAVPLSDEWYSSDGVALSTVLTIVSDHVTVNGNLAGNVDLRDGVYYHLGDLTIDAGVTVTVSLNTQLRIRGALTINGKIDGKGRGIGPITDPSVIDATYENPAPLAVQTLGSTEGSGGLNAVAISSVYFYLAFRGAQAIGIGATPRFVLEVRNGSLLSIPSELRGTPGMYGAPVTEQAAGSPTLTVKAKGGAGGASGAGLMIVTRSGLSFGASGEIDLSGDDGNAPAATITIGGRDLYSGTGGGGAPGSLLVLNDGNDVPLPDLATAFTAEQGATPQAGNPIESAPPGPDEPWTGNYPGLGSLDMRVSAHFATWAPEDGELGDSADEGTPAPRNLAADADSIGVVLTWELPAADRFDFVELFESIDNDRANAVLIYRGLASSFEVTSGAEISRYYWIRARDDKTGPSEFEPLSATAGVAATFGGATGSDGEDAVLVSVAPQFAQWRQAPNGGAFEPAGTTCDITFTFKQGGSTIATHVIRVTRSGATLTAATQSESGEATTENVSIGTGTAVMTVLVQHTDSGVTGAQAISVVVGGVDGADGDDGLPGSNALNADPGFRDISLAAGHWTATSGGDLSTIAATAIVTDGKVGRRVLRVDSATEVPFWSEEIPIDPARNYQVSVWARQESGGPLNYLLVAFFDADGVNIDNSTSDATGWLAIGSYHYWARANQAFGTSFTSYSINFGPNSSAKIPTGAVSCRIGSLANFGGAAAAENIDFQDFRLTRLISLTDQIYGQLVAAFAAAGLVNTNISVNADGSLVGAGGGAPVISSLSGSVATGQLTANVVAALQAVIGNLAAIHADLGTITAGNITLASGGYLRSPAISYDGNGVFIGYDAGEAAFSIRQGSNFLRYKPSVGYPEFNGVAAFINSAQTFSPSSWTGFSSDPSGDISYIDFGAYVLMFRGASLTGTSDDTPFSFDGVPTAIRPAADRSGRCEVIDNSNQLGGAWSITSGGTVTFRLDDTSSVANRVRALAATFTASGTKGIPAGWLIVFPK